MTPEQIRRALASLSDEQNKRLRDAYYAAAAAVADVAAVLTEANQPELAKERCIFSEAKTTIDRSVLGRVL